MIGLLITAALWSIVYIIVILDVDTFLWAFSRNICGLILTWSFVAITLWNRNLNALNEMLLLMLLLLLLLLVLLRLMNTLIVNCHDSWVIIWSLIVLSPLPVLSLNTLLKCLIYLNTLVQWYILHLRKEWFKRNCFKRLKHIILTNPVHEVLHIFNFYNLALFLLIFIFTPSAVVSCICVIVLSFRAKLAAFYCSVLYLIHILFMFLYLSLINILSSVKLEFFMPNFMWRRKRFSSKR